MFLLPLLECGSVGTCPLPSAGLTLHSDVSCPSQEADQGLSTQQGIQEQLAEITDFKALDFSMPNLLLMFNDNTPTDNTSSTSPSCL